MDTKWGNSDFKTDVERSKRFAPYWKLFYQSEYFHHMIKKLRLRGDIIVTDIDQSENEIFQKNCYLDAIVKLSCGESLKIDEKTNKSCITIKYGYGYENEGKTAVSCGWCPVEVWSNSNKDGKHDGWGYHLGTTIVQTYADDSDICFHPIFKPVIYNISIQFIDEIIRNEKQYPSIPNSKSTNGLYRSGYKWVPRNVLEGYFP